MTQVPPLKSLLQAEYDEALKCVKCGFCLPACPTYNETGVETASPRGRLALVRAFADGKLSAEGGLADALDLCLGCRACETACPSGLQYGQVLEGVRAVLEPQVSPRRTPGERLLRWGMFKVLLRRPALLQRSTAFLSWLQRLGVLRMAQRVLPKHLARLVGGLPPLPGPTELRQWRALFRPLPDGSGWLAAGRKSERRHVVAFFPGCFMQTTLMPVNLATVRLLNYAGYGVLVPAHAGCCGALHAHAGDHEIARRLAVTQIDALESAERTAGPVEAIVTNSGGCGSHQLQLPHLLPGHSGARRFAARIRDLSQILAEAEIADWQPVHGLAVYQESCHLAHGQKVHIEPRALLRRIPGLTLRELKNQQCCGSAGFYNLVQPQMSSALLEAKVSEVRSTQPNMIVTGNPGCLLHLRAGLHEAGLTGQVEVLHVAQVIERSIQPALRQQNATRPG